MRALGLRASRWITFVAALALLWCTCDALDPVNNLSEALGPGVMRKINGLPAMAVAKKAGGVEVFTSPSLRGAAADWAVVGYPAGNPFPTLTLSMMDMRTIGAFPALALSFSPGTIEYYRGVNVNGTTWTGGALGLGGMGSPAGQSGLSLAEINSNPAIVYSLSPAAAPEMVRYARADDALGTSWTADYLVENVVPTAVSLLDVGGVPGILITTNAGVDYYLGNSDVPPVFGSWNVHAGEPHAVSSLKTVSSNPGVAVAAPVSSTTSDLYFYRSSTGFGQGPWTMSHVFTSSAKIDAVEMIDTGSAVGILYTTTDGHLLYVESDDPLGSIWSTQPIVMSDTSTFSGPLSLEFIDSVLGFTALNMATDEHEWGRVLDMLDCGGSDVDLSSTAEPTVSQTSVGGDMFELGLLPSRSLTITNGDAVTITTVSFPVGLDVSSCATLAISNGVYFGGDFVVSDVDDCSIMGSVDVEDGSVSVECGSIRVISAIIQTSSPSFVPRQFIFKGITTAASGQNPLDVFLGDFWFDDNVTVSFIGENPQTAVGYGYGVSLAAVNVGIGAGGSLLIDGDVSGPTTFDHDGVIFDGVDIRVAGHTAVTIKGTGSSSFMGSPAESNGVNWLSGGVSCEQGSVEVLGRAWTKDCYGVYFESANITSASGSVSITGVSASITDAVGVGFMPLPTNKRFSFNPVIHDINAGNMLTINGTAIGVDAAYGVKFGSISFGTRNIRANAGITIIGEAEVTGLGAPFGVGVLFEGGFDFVGTGATTVDVQALAQATGASITTSLDLYGIHVNITDLNFINCGMCTVDGSVVFSGSSPAYNVVGFLSDGASIVGGQSSLMLQGHATSSAEAYGCKFGKSAFFPTEISGGTVDTHCTCASGSECRGVVLEEDVTVVALNQVDWQAECSSGRCMEIHGPIATSNGHVLLVSSPTFGLAPGSNITSAVEITADITASTDLDIMVSIGMSQNRPIEWVAEVTGATLTSGGDFSLTLFGFPLSEELGSCRLQSVVIVSGGAVNISGSAIPLPAGPKHGLSIVHSAIAAQDDVEISYTSYATEDNDGVYLDLTSIISTKDIIIYGAARCSGIVVTGEVGFTANLIQLIGEGHHNCTTRGAGVWLTNAAVDVHATELEVDGMAQGCNHVGIELNGASLNMHGAPVALSGESFCSTSAAVSYLSESNFIDPWSIVVRGYAPSGGTAFEADADLEFVPSDGFDLFGIAILAAGSGSDIIVSGDVTLQSLLSIFLVGTLHCNHLEVLPEATELAVIGDFATVDSISVGTVLQAYFEGSITGLTLFSSSAGQTIFDGVLEAVDVEIMGNLLIQSSFQGAVSNSFIVQGDTLVSTVLPPTPPASPPPSPSPPMTEKRVAGPVLEIACLSPAPCSVNVGKGGVFEGTLIVSHSNVVVDGTMGADVLLVESSTMVGSGEVVAITTALQNTTIEPSAIGSGEVGCITFHGELSLSQNCSVYIDIEDQSAIPCVDYDFIAVERLTGVLHTHVIAHNEHQFPSGPYATLIIEQDESVEKLHSSNPTEGVTFEWVQLGPESQLNVHLGAVGMPGMSGSTGGGMGGMDSGMGGSGMGGSGMGGGSGSLHMGPNDPNREFSSEESGGTLSSMPEVGDLGVHDVSHPEEDEVLLDGMVQFWEDGKEYEHIMNTGLPIMPEGDQKGYAFGDGPDLYVGLVEGKEFLSDAPIDQAVLHILPFAITEEGTSHIAEFPSSVGSYEVAQSDLSGTATAFRFHTVDHAEVIYVSQILESAAVVQYGTGTASLAAGDVKTTISVTDWVWESPSNRLAFEMIFRTVGKGTLVHSARESGRQRFVVSDGFDTYATVGVFTFAFIDGVQTDLEFSLELNREEDGVHYLTLFFPFGRVIQYDPDFGVLLRGSGGGGDPYSSPIPWISLGLFCLAVVIAVLAAVIGSHKGVRRTMIKSSQLDNLRTLRKDRDKASLSSGGAAAEV